jgi:hypothetical protein
LSSERVERRLTAILAADVAGYRRLMGADEEGTLAQLKVHRTAQAGFGCIVVTAPFGAPGDDAAWGKWGEETDMAGTIVNLIIQLVAGVLGGNAAGASLKDYNLGAVGNTIAGAIGGVGGGQILQTLIPAMAGVAGGDLDVGSIVGQLVGGGASGAVLTLIAGAVKNMMAGK